MASRRQSCWQIKQNFAYCEQAPKCDDADKHLTHLFLKATIKGAVFLNERKNERTKSDFIQVSLPSLEHDFLSKKIAMINLSVNAIK